MRILFSPSCPENQQYSIVAMINYLGYSVARSANEPFDIGYLWDDATHVVPPQELLETAETKPVLNIKCTDISKETVNRVWEQVCGYSSKIDPLQHQGKAVKKLDANGKGVGEIILCPIDKAEFNESYIYQLYIQTNFSGPQLEYRVPIVMSCIPSVFEVLKDDPELVEGKQIQNQYKHSIKLRSVDDIFNQEEQKQIIEFCKQMGFDVGELDILRCEQSRRLYIIDANTTPTYFNMFNRYWLPSDKRDAIALVAECWEEQLKKSLTTNI